MPTRVVYTGKGCGYCQWGTKGKKYHWGPGKEFESKAGAEAAANKQGVAVNLSKEKRGERPEWK